MDPGASPDSVCSANNVPIEQVDLKGLLYVLTTGSNTIRDNICPILFSSAHTSITSTEVIVSIRVNCYHTWCNADVRRRTPHRKVVQTEYRYAGSLYNIEDNLQIIHALLGCPTLTYARFCAEGRSDGRWIRWVDDDLMLSGICKILYHGEKLRSFRLTIGKKLDAPDIDLFGQITTDPLSDHVTTVLADNNSVVRSFKVQLSLAGSTSVRLAHASGRASRGQSSTPTRYYEWDPIWDLYHLSRHLKTETLSTKTSKNVIQDLVLSLNIEGHTDRNVFPALLKIATTQLRMNPNLLKLCFTDSFLNSLGATSIARALRVNTSLKELHVKCSRNGLGDVISPFSGNRSGRQGNKSVEILKIDFSKQEDRCFWTYSQGSIMKLVARMLKRNTTLKHVEVYPPNTTGGHYQRKTAEYMWDLVNQLRTHNTTLQYFSFGVWKHGLGQWNLHRVGAELHATYKGVPYQCWRDRKPPKGEIYKLATTIC